MDCGCVLDKPELVHCYPEQVRKQVVDILKTGDVSKDSLNNDHMLYYLEVCSMSQPLKKACEELLVENLNINNCINALEIGEKYSLDYLKEIALKIVQDDLGTIMELDSFVLLQDKHLKEICKTEHIAKHDNIHLALEKWLMWSPEKRTEMYQSFLQIIQRHRAQETNLKEEKHYRTYHALLLKSGNHKHGVVSIVFSSNGEVVCKRQLFQSSDIGEDFSAVCVQKDQTEAPYVYIVSGKHVIRYDPILNHHESCHSLNHSRMGASVVSFGDYIYVFGGRHGDKSVKGVEELDAKHQKNVLHIKKPWKVVANLPDEFNLSNAACSLFEDKIYIIGDIEIGEDVKTGIISFHLIEKQFKIVCELPQKLSKCKSVTYDCSIFVVASGRHVFKFDILGNTLELCPNLPVEVFNFEMFVSGNVIHIVSYRDIHSESAKPDMLKYNIENNSWESRIYDDFPSNMQIYGCCDIKIPSDTNLIPFERA